MVFFAKKATLHPTTIIVAQKRVTMSICSSLIA